MKNSLLKLLALAACAACTVTVTETRRYEDRDCNTCNKPCERKEKASCGEICVSSCVKSHTRQEEEKVLVPTTRTRSVTTYTYDAPRNPNIPAPVISKWRCTGNPCCQKRDCEGCVVKYYSQEGKLLDDNRVMDNDAYVRDNKKAQAHKANKVANKQIKANKYNAAA